MCEKPFSRERFVRWGDCDPAGVIYTPRVFDYAVETLEDFFKEVLGRNWKEQKKMDVGTPIVRAEFDFTRPPVPDMKIRIEIYIKEVGNSSVTFMAEGFDEDVESYFKVDIIMCYIKLSDFKSINIPDEVRERMVAYKSACDKKPSQKRI